jgi:hypothetical protein
VLVSRGDGGSSPRKELRVNRDGTTTQVADLGKFLQSHPVAKPNPGDFEPDGTWYSMVAVRGNLYAVEPNHGEIDRINPPTGKVSRLIDISASQGHIVPAALAYKGNFFVGTSERSRSHREARNCSRSRRAVGSRCRRRA